MSAGRVQLAAKGLQDQYLTGSPQMSFFSTAFVRHTPFLIKVTEVPVNNSTITFGSAQVCEVSRVGDVIRSITIKLTLPSMFQPGYGLAYPSLISSPTFYYLDAGYNVLASYVGRNIRQFFTNNDTNWLPPVVSFGPNNFVFSPGSVAPVYIGFTNLSAALFWGFKNYVNYVNGYYIWAFTTSSELSYFSGGWIQANSNYFRYYSPSAPLTLIQTVELYIGGQLIESIPSSYLKIWNDINYENAQQGSINYLTGTSFTPSTSDIDYYVKVPFSLDMIPAAAITNQSIEIQIQVGGYSTILDANALNVTNFSNLASCPGANAAVTTGNYDFVANASSLLMYQNGTIVNSYPFAGITGMATDTINVYAISSSNIIQYQPSTNTGTIVNISNTVGFGGSLCITTGTTGLYAYTSQNSFQALINNQFKPYEFPYPSPYLVTTYNGQAFLAITGSAIVVQNLTTPYLTTRYNSIYGSPVQMSSNAQYGMYYTTANSLVTWTGSGFTQVTSIPSAPLSFVTTSVGNILFFRSNVWIVSGSPQIYPVSFSAIASQYVSGSTLLISNSSGGIGTWSYTSATLTPSFVQTNYIFPSIFAGSSNLYAVDSGSNIWQFSNFGSIVNQSVTVQTGLPPNQNFLFTLDPGFYPPRAYFTTTTAQSVYYLLDGGQAVLYQVTPTIPTVTGLKRLFFDGQYIYSFPSDGSSIGYKLNTSSDFRSNASHYTTTIYDNFANVKKMYTGAISFDGQYILATPLATNLDTNITAYNTTLPFVELISFYHYDGFLENGYDYTSIATFGNKMFFGSNSQIYRYQNAPGFTVSPSTISNVLNFGSVTDGKQYVYMFNSNLQANGMTIYNIITGSTTKNNTMFLNYAGNYGVVVKQNSDKTFLVPKDNSNLLLFSLSSINSVTKINLNGNNYSNTACIAGNNLYIFPSSGYNNLYVVNMISLAVSNIWLQSNNYQGASYDGSKFIYLTDPIGNVFRYNTTTDIFNDLPGWTAGTPTMKISYTAQSTTVYGNVIFIANQNIYSTNVITRTTTNNWASTVTSAVISRQPMNNILYFSTSTNLYRYSANTVLGSNLATSWLLDRSLNTQKTVVDMTCGLSNVYISWSDGSLGTLDTTSNDFTGIYYYRTQPVVNSSPTTSVILNSNIYFLTNDNISRISTITSAASLDQRLAGPAGPSNIYSIALALNNNVYAFPSNGNVIVRISDATALSTLDSFSSNIANVVCVTVSGSTIYGFSRTSGQGVAINSLAPLSTGTAQYTTLANASINGASCCFVYSDSNLYILPYGSNIVSSYSLPTINFQNTLTYSSFVGPVGNVNSASNAWVVGGGYLANVISGTSTAIPIGDVLRGRLYYRVTPGTSNLYGFYNGAGLGASYQSYGTIQVSNSSLIDTYFFSGGTSLSVAPTAAVTNFYAMWISQTPVTNFNFLTANVTNHSYYNLVFTFTAPAGYTASPSTIAFNGICTSAADCASRTIPTVSLIQNGVVINQVTPTLAFAGGTLSLTIYATGIAYAVNGYLGTQAVSVSSPSNQTLIYNLPSASTYFAFKTFSVTSPANTFWRAYIYTEPGTITPGQDYYWSSNTSGVTSPFTYQTGAGNFINTANIIPVFAGTWLSTQDGSNFVNAQDSGGLVISPQTYAGYVYDSIFSAGSNIFLANTSTHGYLQKFNTVTSTSNTFLYSYTPIVNINFNNQYTYVLSENSGVNTVGMLDQTNAIVGTVAVVSANTVSSRLSFPISDGMIYVQSNPWSNISGVSPSRFKSFDYKNAWGVQLQQYSCVISVGGTYYLTPTTGNLIIQVKTSTVSQVTGQYIRGYDVNNVLTGTTATSYTIRATVDQFSNVLFTCINNTTRISNVIKYNSLLDLYTPSAWTYRQGTFINSNVSMYNSGYQYAFSNLDSNIIQFPFLGYAPSYYSYQYPIPSVISNVCTVLGSNAYMFPSVAGSNIVVFNMNSKTFSNIGHDAAVLALANVGQYTVLVNPTKINVFQTSNFTSLTQVTFTGTPVSNASVFYDGRYLNVMTPTGDVIFDFSSLAKVSRPMTTSSILTTMQSVNSNIYTGNTVLSYGPRPYSETSPGTASGMYFFNSNLYGKIGSSVVNITTGNTLASLSSSTAIDSIALGNQLFVLSPDSVTTLNVFAPASALIFSKPVEYSSELLTDNVGYIYVPSTQSLNVWRMNTTTVTYQTTVAQNTFTSATSKTYVNQYYENSNLVLTTDQNQQIVFNPNTFISSFMSSSFLPNQLQNNFASVTYGSNIYFFPGPTSNTLQIYNTNQPFNSPNSYSLLNIGPNDIRSLIVNGVNIIGAPTTTSNMIIFNTQTQLINSYYLDTTTNVTANGYISIAFAGQTYILTPRIGPTVQKILTNQTITSNSFSFAKPLISFYPETSLAALVTYGKTLVAVTTSNIYPIDMTNSGISFVAPTTSLYSAPLNPVTAFFDGRFIKTIANAIIVYDTLPLVYPTTLQMSCLVRSAYVGTKEREWMQNSILDYVFTQVQSSNIVMPSATGYYGLKFTGAVTEMIFIASSPINSLEFFVNGYSKSPMDANYLSNLVPYWYYPRTPTSNIYIVPFEPYINMSRIKEPVVYISGNTGSVTTYAKSLNVLRVKDGLAGVVFNGKDR